jgi:hypothetical protein
VHYFAANALNLTALHNTALAAIPDGPAQRNRARRPRDKVVRQRACDGNADRLDVTLPDAGPRTRRLASHTTGLTRQSLRQRLSER